MTRAAAALEAVARRYSATFEQGEVPAQGHLSLEGQRIAVEVASLSLDSAAAAISERPRLRFDRVVLRVVGRLQAALSDRVPEGSAIVFTMTAPIHLPAKTTAALEARVRDCLAAGKNDLEESIHGNEVRVRLVTSGPKCASKLVGFVHSADSDPGLLLDMSQSLFECLGAAAGEAWGAGERWLVLDLENGPQWVETWWQVWKQLAIGAEFTKALMVFSGGRVETLPP